MPEDVWPALDQIQVWLPQRLSKRERADLKALCGSFHTHNKPMLFQPHWAQRLQIRQPNDEGLLYLDHLATDDHLINAIEFSLDLICQDRDEAEQLRHFFDVHLIQRWHGKRRVSRFENVSYWSNKRWTRNQPVIYHDQPSKVTGQVNCCHLEWRTCEASAVRAVGIERVRDLVDFNHRSFWKKRLVLRAIDMSKLGRTFKNSRRRKPWIRKDAFGREFDMDRWIGNIIARASQREGNDGAPARPSCSVQEILDFCRPQNLERALVEISAEPLLPF